MLTFENKYKSIFKELIEAKTNRKVAVSNDIQIRPLEKDIEGISATIRTGTGTLPSIPNFDLFNIQFNINFLIQANYAQELLQVLEEIIREENAKWKDVDIEGTKYKYHTVYSKPYMIGYAQDLSTRTGTYKIAHIILPSINVSYSSNALFSPKQFKIDYKNSVYNVNGLLRYEISEQSNNEPIPIIGQLYPVYNTINYTTVIVLLIARLNDDPLHNLLCSQAFAYDKMGNYPIKLIDGINTIEINDYAINEIWENNTSVIQLTLMR